jgi:hypothetical protein
LFTKNAIKVIPSQWQNAETASAFQKMAKAAAAVLTVAVSASFSATWFLQLSLALLWGLINVIQMIVVLSLVEVIYPTNALTLNSALLTLANFEIIPAESIS